MICFQVCRVKWDETRDSSETLNIWLCAFYLSRPLLSSCQLHLRTADIEPPLCCCNRGPTTHFCPGALVLDTICEKICLIVIWVNRPFKFNQTEGTESSAKSTVCPNSCPLSIYATSVTSTFWKIETKACRNLKTWS